MHEEGAPEGIILWLVLPAHSLVTDVVLGGLRALGLHVAAIKLCMSAWLRAVMDGGLRWIL